MSKSKSKKGRKRIKIKISQHQERKKEDSAQGEYAYFRLARSAGGVYRRDEITCTTDCRSALTLQVIVPLPPLVSLHMVSRGPVRVTTFLGCMPRAVFSSRISDG